jgi:hypothetical protein
MRAVYNIQSTWGVLSFIHQSSRRERAVCFLYTSLASQTSRDTGIVESQFANPGQAISE